MNCVPSKDQPDAGASGPGEHLSVRFPADLRIWLRHSALLLAAQALAQETDPAALRPAAPVPGARFQHPWRMLALLTYACAAGLFADRAAAALAAVEPDLRNLFRDPLPGQSAVRRFRNQNESVLIACLGKLLRHAWCHHAGHHQTALHPLLAIEILCEARARVQRWRTEEANDAPNAMD